MEILNIRTAQFEGPLDLLLFLIQKNELDISAISLHEITDSYVQYVNVMKELNFDIASDFLVMAADLIYIKSKRLLPHDDHQDHIIVEERAPTEEEILRRLREHQKFREAGQRIYALPKYNVEIFARPDVAPPEKVTLWQEMDLTGLTLAIQDVLKRARRRTKVIIRESISLPERITSLGQILKVDELTEFTKILSEYPDKEEIVVTFVALLELARLKKLKVYQNESFGTLYLTLTEEISALDPKLMTGFQYKAHEKINAPTPEVALAN